MQMFTRTFLNVNSKSHYFYAYNPPRGWGVDETRLKNSLVMFYYYSSLKALQKSAPQY